MIAAALGALFCRLSHWAAVPLRRKLDRAKGWSYTHSQA